MKSKNKLNSTFGNFRPLSGNLLSLQVNARCNPLPYKVFVPYRGIYFLYALECMSIKRTISVFVPYRGIYFLYFLTSNIYKKNLRVFVPYRGIYFLYPASRTPLFIRVPELFCGAKFKNCFSFSISYACAAFSLILCGAAQNSFYCRENSILPIPISYNFP